MLGCLCFVRLGRKTGQITRSSFAPSLGGVQQVWCVSNQTQRASMEVSCLRSKISQAVGQVQWLTLCSDLKLVGVLPDLVKCSAHFGGLLAGCGMQLDGFGGHQGGFGKKFSTHGPLSWVRFRRVGGGSSLYEHKFLSPAKTKLEYTCRNTTTSHRQPARTPQFKNQTPTVSASMTLEADKEITRPNSPCCSGTGIFNLFEKRKPFAKKDFKLLWNICSIFSSIYVLIGLRRATTEGHNFCCAALPSSSITVDRTNSVDCFAAAQVQS